MIFIILILAGLFLWWSLSTKKSNPTFTQVINDAQKRQSNNLHNVYKHKFTGMLYAEKDPINEDDKKVYSGTKTQCESYVFRKQNKFL